MIIISFSEEDFHGSYSKIVLKYFLAEGIVSKHSTLIASQDVNPSNIVSTHYYRFIKIVLTDDSFCFFRSKNYLL